MNHFKSVAACTAGIFGLFLALPSLQAAPQTPQAHYQKAESHRLTQTTELHMIVAIASYKRACQQKYGAACWRLGRIFDHKATTHKANATQLHAKATSHYKLACQYKFAEGCTALASIQLGKARNKRQRRKALKLFANACRMGSGSACYKRLKDRSTRLAKKRRSLTQKRRWWKRRKRSLLKIHTMLKAGCQKKFETDCYLLGYLHFKGEPTKAPKRAVTRFQQACTYQSADGCDFLALLYGNGLGVKKDLKLARQHHKRACDLKLPDGCTHYAGMVFRGLGGPKELGIARDLYKRSCGWDHPQACLLLGEMVIRGEGGDRDVYAAFRLYQKSCKLKNQQACARVKALQPILTIGKKKTKPNKD